MLTKGPGSWTEVPITDIAIAHVEALAKQEGQPLIQDSKLLVEWRPNQPFDEDDEYDDDYEPLVVDGEDDIELEVDDTNEDTDDDRTITQDLSQVDLPVTEPVPKHITQPQLEDAEVGTLGEEELNIEEEGATHVEEEGVAHVEEDGVAHMEEEGAGKVEEEGVSTVMGEGENSIGNNEEATQRGGYNLHSNRSREYSHHFDQQVYDVTNTHVSHATRKPVTIAQNMFGSVFYTNDCASRY